MLDRRKFLKTAGALGALSWFSSVTNLSAKEITSGLVKDGEIVTAAHWGVLKLTIKDGKVVKSEPLEVKNSFNNPFQKFTADMIYKSRIKHPYVRKSYLENPDSPKPELRGKDEWVKVSYEDAIKLVVKELKKTRNDLGPTGVFAGSYGWKSTGNIHNSRTLLHRFMNLTGGFVGVLGDYSTGASQVIMPHVLGSLEVYEQQTSWPLVLEHSKVVVIWGANPISTLRIAWTANDELGLKYFEDLKKSGKKLIFIDPIKNETCQYLNARWIAPIPNTDVALMMGMASHLLKIGKYDKEFLSNYTTGFDKFKDYLKGKEDGVEKSVAWASKICGIDEATIKELAELFYDNRTMIMSGWGMQRAHHGEQPHWMLVTLCCMLGQIGLPGGGFGLSYHYSNGGVPECKGGIVGGLNAASVGKFEQGKFVGTANGVIENGKFVEKASNSNNSNEAAWLVKTTEYSFPLARIAEALLNPGKKISHNGTTITYPKIDFIYWVGGNPLVHHQETNTFVKAWKIPRTIVVNEPYWTPTAKMADIVFPTTTQYERNDLTMVGDYSNIAIAPMKQAVEKFEEAKDDYEIFCDLAKEYDFGVYMAFSENGKTEFDWIKQYYDAAYKQVANNPDLMAITPMDEFKEFWAKNRPVEFLPTIEGENFVRYQDFREDPILEALGTPSGLIEIYSETIEKMNYDDCKGHPTWFEPFEWLGMKNKPAKFAVITAHPTDRLHSQLNHTSLRENYAIANREPIWINSQDAKNLGIKTGDLVRVYNKRGEVLCGAFVTDNIKQGVLRLCEGAWYDPDENGLCKNGCSNVLTRDIPTSKLSNGNISHTLLADIEIYKGKAPTLTAFLPPLGAN